MTGVQDTVINFDISEYLSKATRFEVLDELRIMLEGKFSSARGRFKHTKFEDFSFPSNEDIARAVEKGRKRATQLLDYTGLEWEEKDFECVIAVSNRNDILPINEISVSAINEQFETDNAANASEDLIFEANILLNQIGSDFNTVCKYTPGIKQHEQKYFRMIAFYIQVSRKHHEDSSKYLLLQEKLCWLVKIVHTKK